jgi:SAM-dependent methyltransferase
MQPFEDRFSGDPTGYARARPVYPGALGPLLARHAGGTRLAIDCGCGSGQLAIILARCFEQVEALDASEAQLGRARSHPRVRYRVARAEETGLDADCADLVCAAQAVHWFDLPSFWQEVRRVLRPGGAVALVGYRLLRIGEPFDAMLSHFHDHSLAAWWAPHRWQVVSGYADIELPFEEVPIVAPVMSVDWSLDDLLAYLGTWSAVREATDATGVSPLVAFGDELRARWGDPARSRTVRWPLVVRVGRRP